MLKVINLNKKFKIDANQDVEIIHNLSFSIDDFGMYFIIGKSGSGKTTLLNILEGILRPDSGKLIFNNKDIYKMSNSARNKYLKNEIGIIFQSYNLINYLTVKENIKLSKLIKGVKDDSYIEQLIKEFKLKSLLQQKVSTLSGGEKQRVAILRSIINKPSLILCDEPTGALDEENSEIILNTLNTLANNAIVLIVTHNERIIEKYGGKYFVLRDKKIYQEFDKKEIIKRRLNDKKLKNKLGFARFLSKKHTKLHAKKNMITMFSMTFMILILMMTLSFYDGLKEAKYKILSSYINENVFKISKIFVENGNNEHLSILRKEAPTEKEIHDYLKKSLEYEILENLDYFFLSPEIIINNNKYNDIKFLPYIKNRNNTAYYANRTFFEKYENKEINSYKLKFKKTHSILNEQTFELEEKQFLFETDIKISAIVDEFKYLNIPTIYYPYFMYQEILINQKIENENNSKIESSSWFNLLINAKSSDEITSYNKLISVSDPNKIYAFINNSNEKNANLKIENDNLTLVNSFLELSNSLFVGIQFFLAISIICNIFLIGFVTFSSFISHRKDIAILRVLGASENDVVEVFVIEQLLISLFAITFSIMSFLISRYWLNSLLSSIFISDSIIDVNILQILFISLITLISVAFFSSLPLKLTKRIDIAKELKEE